MDIHQGPQVPGKLHYASITNVRQAACLMVLGLELEENGICRHYDAGNPKSTGGIAHFYFKSDQAHEIERLLLAYDKGDANIELDRVIDDFRLGKDLTTLAQLKKAEDFLDKLEPLLRPAIIVWMRQAIDSYHNIVYFLQHHATELIVTGGEPAHDDDGNLIGKQGFQVKVLKRKK